MKKCFPHISPSGIAFLAFFLTLSFSLWGQQLPPSSLSPELLKIAGAKSKPGWIDIREEVFIDAPLLFEDFGRAFGLGPDDEMRLTEAQTDNLGFTHYSFRQFYKKIPVWGGHYIVHSDRSGRTCSANGYIASNLDIDVRPAQPEKAALEKALAQVNEQAGLWNHSEKFSGEAGVVHPERNRYPEGELVLAPKNGRYLLAWKFDLHLMIPEISTAVFIDARSGELLFSYPLTVSCNPGIAHTPWYGQRPINNLQTLEGFILLDNCPDYPYSIRVRKPGPPLFSDIVSPDPVWNSDDFEVGGATTLWCLDQTREYFHFTHNRSSWDNLNANINAILLPGEFNAYWDGSQLALGLAGEGNRQDDFTTIDIVGHEYAHAVTETAAGLIYLNESGALNESFSDIFGEMAEAYALGQNDWLMGGDRGAIRSMSNPNWFGNPDTYQGFFWCDYTDPSMWCTTGDFGGVHINSGVQNFWFFLLVQGGEGFNDNSRPFNVSGIGAAKASAVAYRNLTHYLTPNAIFQDARQGSIRAAIDLFGECSMEVISVISAWEAVGVIESTFGVDLFVCDPIISNSYWALKTLQAGGHCEATISTTDSEVVFTAGDEIVLKEGFSAGSHGSGQFRAHLDTSCPDLPDNLAVGVGGTPPTHTSSSIPDAGFSIPDLEELILIRTGLRLEVFPNPAKDMVSFRYLLSEETNARLTIFNAMGRPVANRKTGSQRAGIEMTETINVSGLPPGLYFCRFDAGAQSVSTRFVITE